MISTNDGFTDVGHSLGMIPSFSADGANQPRYFFELTLSAFAKD